MASNYAPLVAQLKEAVLASEGALSLEVRRAACERQADDPAVAAFIRTVDQHAYKVTDEDVQALGKRMSDDQIFELAVSTALGASMRRLEAGLKALEASRQEVAR